ncbi:type VI secretion system protein TssL, long form [Pseudoalteromonas sp. CST5]|uniref:type VI secretion system protein TssL, long form n=1 Tax=unclassified Pseudoalteromonas TaxID=194690 RepID=UPI002359F0E1|nr:MULTISPECIES: type VI secretion system protein TssL, long form [unclassified Pseudoalteromonas]MDC9514732.1 type VI secretion system protein TssL, long form [Pseudoalteromonas sp. CST1]MDC9538012.1 type VI secretion system protein TssL, long form [Pseudoalteromonas sp. CST3]MDC9542257.1 type VI secretion system protein TssL, long form [Pseudoalteromonas sp. CST2]MDC9547169.1 type VI secretion system protein TssL, long form [Pseudoalteromonas sp. CST4]MDC9549701.1 type VI secretion system pr
MDETIIKPRPGRLGRDTSNTPNVDNDADKTVMSVEPVASSVANTSKVSIFKNPLLEAATDCFSIVISISQTKEMTNIAALKHRCVEAVKRFEVEVRNQGLSKDVITNSRYCLCAILDESVLNSKWSSMEWADESLLSTFHKETFGGEYFYTLLDNALAQPEQHKQFIELQYHCLNLGFKGKYRLDNGGDTKIEEYRSQMYHLLNQLDGPLNNKLSPNWKQRVAAGVELRNQVPLWVIFSVLGLVLLMVYLFINMKLNDGVTSLNDKLAVIHPIAQNESVDKKDKQLLVLEQLLQTEIQMGIVTVKKNLDRIRISINSESLFNQGDAKLLPSIQPILEKLALSLEGTKGRILITGHTDDTPIRTDKYPSNWHLSLARATQVANSMAKSTNLSGRLWPEGKGAAEPIASNSDSASRSLNRRIEIDLLF